MLNFFNEHSSIIIVSLFILEAILTILTINYYFKIKKQTMYSYKNASFLGGSIFMLAMLVLSTFMMFKEVININPVLGYVNNVSYISAFFPVLMLPFAIIFFFFMSISNISLIRHEGASVKNIVGSFLGFFLILATIAIVFGWDIVYEKIIFKIYCKGYDWITIFDYAIPQFLEGLICYLECLLLGTIISSIKVTKFKPKYDKDYVIILGCAISKDGTPLPLLRGRIDRAIEFSKEQFKATGKKIKFVTSGGQGSDECMSEARSMKNYLLSQGIDESDILIENKSVNTLENMKFSKSIIEDDHNGKNIIFSTTNYHVFRSGIYAGKAGLDAKGIGSKTKWYFWPNAFVREFVALLVSKLRGHIVNIIVILALCLFSGYNAYLLNV